MSNVATDFPNVDRLMKIARRVEQGGKKDTAAAIYEAASEIARLRQENSPEHFVDFVLRHTLPERAKAHGFETVYSLIKYHPFARRYVSSQEHGGSENVR